MSDPTQTTLSDLIALNRHVSTMGLKTSHIRSRQNGEYLSRIKGRGIEFNESRPYQPGDDVRNIDWRVTARTGNTHTKVFCEERERPVFISVDARAPMFFATQGRFKSVIAAQLASLLAWVANHQGDRVGGEIFNETGHTEFRPRRRKKSILHLLKALSTLSPVEHAVPISLHPSLQRLHRIAHPGSLVCVISDFRGLDDRAQTHLVNLSRHSEVLLLHVYDPLEVELPHRGQYHVAYEEQILSINASDQAFRQRYQRHHSERVRRLEKLRKAYPINLIHCQTNDSPLELLQDTFSKRHRPSSRRAV